MTQTAEVRLILRYENNEEKYQKECNKGSPDYIFSCNAPFVFLIKYFQSNGKAKLFSFVFSLRYPFFEVLTLDKSFIPPLTHPSFYRL